jgi:hypothetical protein
LLAYYFCSRSEEKRARKTLPNLSHSIELPFELLLRRFGAVGGATALALAAALSFAAVVAGLAAALALAGVLSLTGMLFLNLLIGFLISLILGAERAIQRRKQG